MVTWKGALFIMTPLLALLGTPDARGAVAVSIVADAKPGAATGHGIRKLQAALAAKGLATERVASLDAASGRALIVVGRPAGEFLTASGTAPPKGAESLTIEGFMWQGGPLVAIAGGDDRGMMYAVLDVADRIGWAADPAKPFSEVRSTREAPAVVERALSMYTMNRAHFETRFTNEDFWVRYLDTLARNRFNTFVLIFGYENGGYFAPPYPYFFDVEGFPDVRVVGITPAQQRTDLAALRRIIVLCHERGLNFTPAIWDHIYRGGVQGPTSHAKKPMPGLVWGVTADNLTAYTKVALAKFLRAVPDIDAIQFRMHGESGLKRGEMSPFWTAVYDVVKEARPDIRFDARAKNFPHELIDKAIERGIRIRMTTKYWAEQMGMPFHPTHINRQNQRDRRHGYGDMLRYPKTYDMHWRLWNGGTTRVLLWADPDYVRRFAESTHLYDGQGFEVNEMLATKMQDHPHDMTPSPVIDPKYSYTDYEFERYWHYFQVFGRLGYNPATPSEVWEREFERRFGKEAAPFVERGIHRASQVLPRIVATCFPYKRFPTTRGWAAKQRREDLPEYARAEGSDTQQFISLDQAARLHLEGVPFARLHPLRNSEWYAQTAKDVLGFVAEAERRIGDRRSKEFAVTMVDLRVLANLSLYHARRIHAGMAWSFWKHAGDLNRLDDAILHEGRAIEAWRQIVQAAGDVYHQDLMFGRRSAGLSGHWKDELTALEQGLAKLEGIRKTAVAKPGIAHVPIRKAPLGRDIVIRATIGGKGPVTLTFGTDGRLAMKETGPHRFEAIIPAASVTPGLTYAIETAGGAKSPSQAVLVTNDHDPPLLVHKPIVTAPAAKPLTVSATVTDSSGVKWVRLRYRSVTQFDDYRTLAMERVDDTDVYRATVPAEHVPPAWDFMYLFEVADDCGNARIYPDFERETPYIVVRLQRNGETP